METLIQDVNDIKNLVALCPNHHKELDKGLIKLEKYH
jgi:predicted restriction endonuclease